MTVKPEQILCLIQKAMKPLDIMTARTLEEVSSGFL